MKRIILLSGGIGAGKSVVSRILKAKGYPVYDCDSEAKELMDTDIALCSHIDKSLSEFTDESLIDTEGHLKKLLLSDIVFSNPKALKILNSIVHPSVLKDITEWAEKQSCICFIESAIPQESGLRQIVDAEWIVEAPEQIRIQRVMLRNGCTEESVKHRIEVQRNEWITPHPDTQTINNDNRTSLLLQINHLLLSLNRKK